MTEAVNLDLNTHSLIFNGEMPSLQIISSNLYVCISLLSLHSVIGNVLLFYFRCPKYSNIPSNCHFATTPGECCEIPVCEFQQQHGVFTGKGSISGNGAGLYIYRSEYS